MPGRPHWTPEQVEHLRERIRNEGHLPDVFHRIAEDMGRTPNAIRQKVWEIGIARHLPKTGGDRGPAPPYGVSQRIAERLGVSGDSQPIPQKRPAPTVQAAYNTRLSPGLIISDLHAPYHCKHAWSLAMQVARDLRPEWLVTIGDFADFYAVSDHDKSPERANRFDEELEEVERLLDELDALGAKDKLFIEGNHEDRLRRYLMKNPALARVVSTERLLRLKERGWEFVPYKRHAARGAIHYTHDVGAAGRNAIFRALDVYQHSVVTGHTHRLQYIVEGSAVGECKISAAFGWMGDVEQVDYMNLAKARKDWARGFGIGYFDASSGFTYLVPVPVVENTVCVNGQLYRSAA